jgi:hypothetical protein
MKLIVLTIISTLLLVGCGTEALKVTPPEVVKVAVETKCQPTTKITPINDDPMDRATKEMSAFEKTQLALASADLYKGQNKELTAALKECTQDPAVLNTQITPSK